MLVLRNSQLRCSTQARRRRVEFIFSLSQQRDKLFRQVAPTSQTHEYKNSSLLSLCLTRA